MEQYWAGAVLDSGARLASLLHGSGAGSQTGDCRRSSRQSTVCLTMAWARASEHGGDIALGGKLKIAARELKRLRTDGVANLRIGLW